MIGFYNYTVILTYIGFCCAGAGLYASIAGKQGTALLMLMLAGLCDMFDGKIARTRERTEQEKRFGIQIDSLSDLFCFGVLPAVIGYNTGLHRAHEVVVLMLFPLAALIRLAYFNVMEEERQEQTTERRKEYEGLPVTSVSLILPLLYCLRHDIGKHFPQVYAAFLLMIGIAFITGFRVKKPGMKVMLSFILVGLLELLFLIYKSKGGA